MFEQNYFIDQKGIMKKLHVQEPPTRENAERKAYAAPMIVLELDLETRAGSTLPDSPDPLDLVGLGTDSNVLP